jgi:hypothetical protein
VSSAEDLVADLKSELDFLDDKLSTVDTRKDVFMKKAIEEALREAKEQDSNVVVEKESFLNNKEIRAEIEKIFDKANDKLLQGLEEIRAEQVC